MIKRVLVFFVFMCSIVFYGQDYDNKTINNKQTISQVSAFPNPFNDESQIIFYSKNAQSILFEVKNILGRSVYKKEILSISGKNEIQFLKDKLASGMYIYSIQTNTETISKRLVIK